MMKNSAYGKPILINGNESFSIERYTSIDEKTLQDLVFKHPECLPISEIDETYNPALPVCCELNTPVGPLDILMITPNGDIVIIETKLWRNPEARRKVVAQILDYANELSKWSYEDLQREINRVLKAKGNTLYNIAMKAGDSLALNESDFVDTVSRNLRRGKFLLLIVGDGIKEGASNIANFLLTAGNMNFSLSMIELTVYKLNDSTKIILPRTIVKTIEIQKINIELPDGFNFVNNGEKLVSEVKNTDKGISDRRAFFTNFWQEFISELDLDDPGQALPNPTGYQNLFLYPMNNKNAWISAYFMQSNKRIGVYFRCANNNIGKEISTHLGQFADDIKKELNNEDVRWSQDSDLIEGFGVRLTIDDVYRPENREKIKEFFNNWINKFVNAIRPRIKELEV